MSRSSRITMALTELRDSGIVHAFTRMPGKGQVRWLLSFPQPGERIHQEYMTSAEAEAFILGVQAASTRA